jgi:hypothetical protein
MEAEGKYELLTEAHTPHFIDTKFDEKLFYESMNIMKEQLAVKGTKKPVYLVSKDVLEYYPRLEPTSPV